MVLVKASLKAILAALIAALSVLAGFLVNNTSLGDITAGQWVAVALAALIALGAVWSVPNIRPSAAAKR